MRPVVDSEQRAITVSMTALRVFVGVIFTVHGSMKLLDMPGTLQGFAQMGIPYPEYAVYLAIAGELLGGLGLVFGAATRIAALGTLASMAVAIGYAHIGHGLLAQNGGWEYPAVLALVSLFFVTAGAGPVSVDARFSRREREERRRDRQVRVSSYA